MDERILDLREKIDKIDKKIINLIKNRMDIAKEVGKIKSTLNIPIEDKKREEEIISRLVELSDGSLNPNQLIRIITALFKISKQVQ